MRLEELADGPDLRPERPAFRQIAPDREGVPQAHGELRDEVRRAPDGTPGARGERVEGQRVPAVEGGDAVVQAEEQLGEARRVTRGVLEVPHAHVGERGDVRRGERQAAGGGDVVVHDGQLRRVADRGHQLSQLLEVHGVVEGRDHHQGCGGGCGCVGREVHAIFGGQRADAGYDGDAAAGVLDA